MFIYIETLLHKRQDRFGAYKEYKVNSTTFCFTGHEKKPFIPTARIMKRGVLIARIWNTTRLRCRRVTAAPVK